jgi:2,4-dienoyl-CoA reductase-like NADH-dependent reductase (Old Yellow Enzyme family)
MSAATLLSPGQLGPLETRNRMIRAGTSETMAGPVGEVTPQLQALYATLADGTGAIFTGHLFCHSRGRYARRQTGIYDDRLIPGLRELTDGVHRRGGRILAQLAHAGSQSRAPDVDPLAP